MSPTWSRRAVDEPAPLRADAQRNLARILDAADRLFAVDGPATSTAHVAREAGVAIGTVFRHFPTKADLVEAVFVRRLHRLADAAELARDSTADPGDAFRDLFVTWSVEFSTKQLFIDALVGAGVDVTVTAGKPAYLAARSRLDTAVADLLQRAQATGDVRADLAVDDVHALVVGTARALSISGGATADSAVLRVVLSGLGPE